MNTKTLFSSSTDNWSTPEWLFEALDNVVNFTLDPCADHVNAKCKKYYTKDDDGLCQSWQGERVFLNPPYGRDISLWVEKAAHEALHDETIVVALLPSRTCTAWWHDYVSLGEVEFLRGRLSFGNGTGDAPFPSCIVTFGAANNLGRDLPVDKSVRVAKEAADIANCLSRIAKHVGVNVEEAA